MGDTLNHFPLASLRWIDKRYDNWMPNSRALICMRSTVRAAILFVHGWSGNAGDTWEAFPRALRFLPEAADADVFLLDYPSKKHSVAFCAAPLRVFLRDLLKEPISRIVNPSMPEGTDPRPTGMQYDRIVLVAHSMGAVVSRRALLDLDQDDELTLTEADRGKFRLLFFAPAHKGSSIPLIIRAGLGLDWLPGATLVGMALEVHFRSLQDLKPRSDCLVTLEKDCKVARKARTEAGESLDYLRAHVYHAQGDKVVVQDGFDRDYAMHPVMKKNHRSICKPDYEYRDPLEGLRAAL
ncbi:MAG: hypothetical protein NTAFB01_06780 [Nitrospira sp.]